MLKYNVTFVPVKPGTCAGWAARGLQLEACDAADARAQAEALYPTRTIKTVRCAVNQRRAYWQNLWAKAAQRCGSRAELARRLGYVLTKGARKGKPQSVGMYARWARGCKPRDTRTALKLIALAG